MERHEERRKVKLSTILPMALVIVIQVLTATWFLSQITSEVRENRSDIASIIKSFEEHKRSSKARHDDYIIRQEMSLYQGLISQELDFMSHHINELRSAHKLTPFVTGP